MRSNIVAASNRIYNECHEIVGEISQDKWFTPAPPFVNHVAWHIGHLAATMNFGLKVLGQELVLSKDWAERYGKGSVPSNDPTGQPSATELLAAMNQVRSKLIEAYLKADESVIAAENVIERLRVNHPHNGDFVTYLLTSHGGVHAGQLYMLRKLLLNG
jgi:hypothetical protein